MSVNGISSGSNPYAVQNPYTQTKQDMQALQSALNSGNLSSAQTDFASFSSDISSLLQNAPSSQAQQPTADLPALQGALNSGNLATAQTDLTTLQQDLKGMGKHHGHHHHQDMSSAGASGTTYAPGTSSATTGTTGTSSSSVAAMLAAYSMGSNTGSAGLVNATA